MGRLWQVLRLMGSALVINFSCNIMCHLQRPYQVRLSAWIIKKEQRVWEAPPHRFPCGSLAGLHSHPGLFEDPVSHVHCPGISQEYLLASKTQALLRPLPETVELMKMATLLGGSAGRGPA